MSLRRLTIRDFRCIETAELEFDDRCNVVSGENASGKTSLLEAIFFLGRGRSFRTARNDTLIRKSAEDLLLSGRLLSGDRSRAVGVRCGREGIEARAGGEPVRGLAELATILPVQAIDPEVHRLVEEGPQERRRYLDWGVFHVEPAFVDHWRRYQRALRQRNAALRAESAAATVRAWDGELVAAGESVAGYRQRYIESLAPYVSEVGRRLLGHPVEISLNRGWAGDLSLAGAVDAAWVRDSERRLTHAGPHRADLSIRVAGEVARDRISRGQQKLVAASMLLGQLRCDAALGSPLAILLVDDPAAELDAGNLDRFLQEVVSLPAQLFFTALDRRNPSIASLPAGHSFHVEHGQLTRLV
jgi:DNA replication and repair protein RecF